VDAVRYHHYGLLVDNGKAGAQVSLGSLGASQGIVGVVDDSMYLSSSRSLFKFLSVIYVPILVHTPLQNILVPLHIQYIADFVSSSSIY
jgi:hypothetical protein